ncbi:hypothetical protein [Streptomyces tauricus]|uniref:hypothetical protein n=1 Tax=Streptomyces tauricus TaxID=68274 RepID=UPI0022433DCD|nr:hypothetical protein [Streptomyces tauricus]MCW8103610.1 hypothetical protein [Streptomyces tauricus]
MFTKPCDHGLGRSHGGFTTRPYLLVEQSQQPTSILATARQHGDSLQFETVLEKDSLPRAAPPRPAEPAAAAGVDSVSCWSTEVTMALHSAGRNRVTARADAVLHTPTGAVPSAQLIISE